VSKLRTPAIIVNFKTYLEATGKRAVELAKICEHVSDKTNVTVGVAPQFTDLVPVKAVVSIPIFAQHMDPVEPGNHTGHVLPESIKEAGVIGTLINHSERRLDTNRVAFCIKRAKSLGLLSVVCADTPRLCEAVARESPHIVAIEPPELIGSGVPVSKAKPELVTKTVKLVRDINKDILILCGAGITTGDDVAAALRLGTQGVLLSSGIVKAKNPQSVLESMTLSATK